MRKIEFRGKQVDNGEWVYGCFAEFVNYLDGDTKPGIQVTNQVPSGFDRMIPAFETELVEVIPETVGQSTGLKDCNDILIHEGDILRFSVFNAWGNDTQNTGVVKFESGGWEIWHKEQYEFYGDDGAFYLFWVHQQDDEIEVLGNIYDNPELMEVER